jgi:hypothetical protein
MMIKANSARLHTIGVEVALEKLGFSRTAHKSILRLPDRRQCCLYVQNSFDVDGSFSIEVSPRENFVKMLKENVLVFVSYSQTGHIFFNECLDSSNYTVEYVKGSAFGSNLNRIILRFALTNTRQIADIADFKLWERFARLSQAKRFQAIS